MSKKIKFLSIICASSLFSADNFVGLEYNYADKIVENVCGCSESKSFPTIKFGQTEENYRYYLSVSPITWDSATALISNLNLDYKQDLFGFAKAYIGASIGYSYIDGDFSGSAKGFNYGLNIGISKEITKDIAIDVGYKYINSDNLTANNGKNFFTLKDIHPITVSVNYKF